MEGIIVLIMLASWIAAACICGHLARKKGRSPTVWFVLGLLFGWFAVLIVACLNTDEAALRRIDHEGGAEDRPIRFSNPFSPWWSRDR